MSCTSLIEQESAKKKKKNLLRIYLSIMRPVVEYACPVWHTNLRGYLSDGIEVVQKRALRTMHPDLSYSEAMEKSKVQTLSDRREKLCQM